MEVKLIHRPALRICSLIFESNSGTPCTVSIQESRIRLTIAETHNNIDLKLGGECDSGEKLRQSVQVVQIFQILLVSRAIFDRRGFTQRMEH